MTKHIYLIRGVTPCSLGGGYQLCREHYAFTFNLFSNLNKSKQYAPFKLFPGGKERPGRDTDPSPTSSAVVMKGQSYTSTPPMHLTACTEPQCLYKGDFYLYFTGRLDVQLQRQGVSVFGLEKVT
jgi:hypothetical protein